MLRRLIEFSLEYRYGVLIAMAMIVAFGIWAVKHTPIDAIPDLSDVQVIIKTAYSGQSPAVVEDQVTYPLAVSMLSVPGATTVRAYSFFGDSYVYVLFKDGTDPYWARSRVLEYLSQVSSKLPAGVKPELGPDATGVGWVFQYALTDPTGSLGLADLTSLQNWFLKFELQSVPGVSEVATVGGMVKQYQISLDPNKMRAYGISMRTVRQAIQDANMESGGSVIEMAEAEYMVRGKGYLKGIDSIESILINHTKKGVPVLLGDIATVSLGNKMRRGVAELDGKGEVVGGIIVMRQGENALSVINHVKDKLDKLKSGLPKGVDLVTTYDRSTLINHAVETLNHKLVEEFIVVVLVCSLFLFHFRSSLIVLVSLPVGILCAYIIMYLQGINTNIMSLGGIAIAIGAMVDATIVMIENVHKHLESKTVTHENRLRVIIEASQEVGPALFFSLMVITISFLPIFSLQGQEGKLFAPLAYTKTYSMAAAAILSVILIPILMFYFIRGKIVPENKNPVNRLLVFVYKPFIRLVLKFPKVIVLLCLTLIVLTYYPAGKLGSEFLPQMDEGDWMYMPTMMPGVSIGKARQVLQQTNKLIMTVPEVEHVFGKVGRAYTATDPAPLTMIESVIQFKPESEWRDGVTRATLKDEFNSLIKFPGLTNAWVMPIRTRIDMLATGIKTPIGIKISGPELSVIESIGQQIETILKPTPGTLSVYADRSEGGRYINIDIDRKVAAKFGLTIHQIQTVIQHAIGGATVTQMVEGRERYPVNIRYPQADRDTIAKLNALPVVTTSGAHIPLSRVTKISIDDGPPVIKSENARLTGWVLIDTNEDVGSYVEKAKHVLSEKLNLPPMYSLSWSGQYEYMERAKEQLMIVVPMTIVAIMLLLFMYFRNVMEVLIIMLTLPLALVGGVWLLWLLNYQWSVAVSVGFIALSGVAVEIGVVMLVYLKKALADQVELITSEERQLTEQDIITAIIQGTLKRIRPIVMTVAAIVAGLLPIMFSDATGSEVMKRIAAPMVGGMLSAMVLTLLLIPALYLLWKRNRLKLKGIH